MRKLILFSSILGLVLLNGACTKDDSCIPKTVASEEAAMQSYMASNGIVGTQHASGMYYQVISPGSGPTPTHSNTLSVRYVGKLTNGTIFDSSTTPVSFQLGNVIPGWQLGLPLIQEGGFIKLVIPSSLAYGCEANGAIPANSILYFEIDLVDVN